MTTSDSKKPKDKEPVGYIKYIIAKTKEGQGIKCKDCQEKPHIIGVRDPETDKIIWVCQECFEKRLASPLHPFKGIVL